MSAESFTVLAILEARDRASEIFAKVDESLGRFSETAKGAADTARGAGDAIDEALGRVVPASDRLEVADARLGAAQAKAAESAKALTAAEKELLAAQQEAAAGTNDTVAADDRLIAADAKLTAAQKEAAVAAKGVRDAQAGQVTALKAAAAAGDENAAAQVRMKESAVGSGISLGAVGKVAGIAALGMGVAGALMVKAAGNFQDSTTHLVTDAGESAKNLSMVQAGILQVSTATGTSAADITNAMYHIESGGQHGAAGLGTLKVAAEGARVGGADLDTVSKTLIGTLNAYGMVSSNAGKQTKMSAQLMNQLVATVGAGDMRMQDLASSLSNVAPLASKAHISFAQVGGAIATMTAQGMSAQQATQNLANTIRGLSNPNAVAIKEMQQMGLNSQDVAKHLGKRGLTGTLDLLTTAITSHMGKSGDVLMSTFQSAKVAAQDANVEISAMPSNLQTLAKGFLSGSITAKSWRADLQGLSPVQQHLMQQFATTAEKAHSFNSLLTSGSPAAQTYTAALAKMTGGATGLNTSLMLTGGNASVFARNAALIGKAAKDTSGQVTNWDTIQGTFNYKLDTAKTAVENTGIAIGSALLPAATALLSKITAIVTPIAEWTASHRKLTEILFAGVAAVAATIAVIAGLRKAYKAVSGAVDTVKAAMKAVGLMSKKAAGEVAESAASEEASSAEAAAAMEGDAAEVAAANDEAAVESSGSWAASAGKMISSAARWVAQSAVKVATVTAQYAVAAASAAAGWAVSAGKMIAQAAIWVGTNIAKVAIVVGANIAGALATAAAWIAANAVMLLGITLIVAAVAAAVYLIISHWSDIVHGVKVAWNAVYGFIHRVISDVISFFKSHWPLIVGIFLGPIALVAAEIFKHWDQIKAFVTKAVTAVIDFVKSHWRLIVSILAGPLGIAVALVTKYWGDIKRWFTNGVSDVLGILRHLGSEVESIGGDIVRGLWKGISGAGGWLLNQIKGFAGNVLSSIGSFFGIGSPSKYTTYHGLMLGEGIGGGFLASLPKIMSSVRKVTSSVLGATSGMSSTGGHSVGSALAASAVGSAGGGGVTVVINVHDNTLMSDSDMNVFMKKLEPTVVRALAQAGVKVRFG